MERQFMVFTQAANPRNKLHASDAFIGHSERRLRPVSRAEFPADISRVERPHNLFVQDALHQQPRHVFFPL